MNNTVYASFDSMHDAEKALGALLDHGFQGHDVSVIIDPDRYDLKDARAHNAYEVLDVAGNGITTTTASDATATMPAGAAMGLGVGALAGLAALMIPGIGLVLGGGALATALAGAAGATVAGAVAGGAYGYLKDQGAAESASEHYKQLVENGNIVLAIDTVASRVNAAEIHTIIAKYNGTELASPPREAGYATDARY